MPRPKPQQSDDDSQQSEGGGVGEIAGEVVSEGMGSVIEGAGGCLEGCGSCSLAVLVALFLVAGTAMAAVRLLP
ncbi:MAG TPA: hypothetical protein VMZ71_10830 [Gemmataceae bacterium]|nr:hypothetical protein [Gemmataceae bacterium]